MFNNKFAVSIIIASTLILVGGVILASKKDTKIQEDKSKVLKIVDDDHIKGNSNATVALVEYLDFECEACGAYYPIVKQLSEEFKDDVMIVSRYFPLQGHKNGMQSALAVESANKQGKYWEMYNILFENQKSWGERQSTDPAIFENYAKQIGLDLEQFKKDVVSDEVMERVNRDLTSGKIMGITGTPTFYLNGEKIANPKTIDDFRTLIKAKIISSPKVVLGEKVHEHADFKVYLNDKPFDFTNDKYQSTTGNPLDPEAHLHDGNGEVTHKHRKGVTLEYFFKSIGITFNNDCFVLDSGTKYCNDDKNSLKFLVNGKANNQFGDYEFNDLERILISYGPKDQDLNKQISSVTDLACMYSEKCPERGKPPTEGCVAGLGGDC